MDFSTNKSIIWILGCALSLFLLFAYFSASIDLHIAEYFFNPSTRSFSKNGFFEFMYTWGVVPGQIVGLAAAAVLILSYAFEGWKKYRKPALLLVLTMAIGAGFITHSIFKDHWGRPRPKQIEQFGGDQPYRPFYEPNFYLLPSQYKSFPCGHCTMGFFFIAFIFLGWRLKSQSLYWLGIILTAFLGISLGLTRMGLGGHFFSDVVVAAIIMWLTAWVCDWLIYSEELT